MHLILHQRQIKTQPTLLANCNSTTKPDNAISILTFICIFTHTNISFITVVTTFPHFPTSIIPAISLPLLPAPVPGVRHHSVFLEHPNKNITHEYFTHCTLVGVKPRPAKRGRLRECKAAASTFSPSTTYMDICTRWLENDVVWKVKSRIRLWATVGVRWYKAAAPPSPCPSPRYSSLLKLFASPDLARMGKSQAGKFAIYEISSLLDFQFACVCCCSTWLEIRSVNFDYSPFSSAWLGFSIVLPSSIPCILERRKSCNV